MSSRIRAGLLALMGLAACGRAPEESASAPTPAEAVTPSSPAAEAPPADAAAPEDPPEVAQEPQVVPSNGDGFRLEWSTQPSPPPLNSEFSVRFRLLDPDGTPLAPPLSTVRVDADMPAHGHGMNVAPSLVEADGWVEAAPLLFHMPGAWELYVDRSEGALTERAQVSFEVH